MYYIGIDIGSTYVKSVLIDMEAGKARQEQRFPAPAKRELKNRRCFEISAEELLAMVRTQAECFADLYEDIKGVILSTQMHGFVYCTEGREDRYISWQDMRCLDRKNEQETYMDSLAADISRQDMENHGVYIKPSLGLCNLYTLLEEEDLPRDGELFTLGSYIIAGLTGENRCHIMNAAPLGLADVKNCCWDKPLLERLGFHQIRLPKLAESDTEICGFWSYKGTEIPVYPDFGDQQCAILGSMTRQRDAVINIATASQVSVTTKEFRPGPYEIRPYFGNQYINTISNMPSGRNLDVLIDFLGEFYQRLSGQKAEKTDLWKAALQGYDGQADGLLADMSFYALPDKRQGGEIRGITNVNLNTEHLFAAAFENMADTYWEHIKKLAEEEEIQRLVCAGGVSWKRPELLKKIGERSGKLCTLSAVPDEALNGLYRIALLCEGSCQTPEEHPELILQG